MISTASLWPSKLGAAPQWRTLETPRFTVVSQISEKETRAWAEEFNQFIDALGKIFKIENRMLSPLTIVIFEREKDFASYRPIAPNGKSMDWVSGFFSQRDGWSVIGMLDHWEDESMRRSIYQEGAYWVLSADFRRHPAWLTFGVAQVFSTFTITGGKAKWGDVIEQHVRYLSTRELIPMEKFLFVSQEDKMFSGREGPDLFYAQSWAFVHYLMFGQRKGGKGSLGEYLTAMQGQSSSIEAFQNTFGMDYAAMREALDDYFRGGKFRMYAQPVEPSAKITAPFTPALPAQVQAALAQLAFGANRNELAKKNAEEAVKLDPDFALGHKMLGWARNEGGDVDGCLAAAEKSVQLGANSADAFFLLALAKTKKAQSLGGIPPAEARQISRLYEKAINLSPTLKPAYLNLASTLSWTDELNGQDELFAEQGLKLFPDEPSLVVGRAQVLRKKGDKAGGLKILQAVLDEPGKLSLEQQKYYRKLKGNWDSNDTTAQANELLKQKQPKEALVLLDGLLQRDPPIESRNAIAQLRWRAMAMAALQDARAAEEAGNRDEAVRLYQSVADMERAPANLRGVSRQALQKLKGAPAKASTIETPAEQ